MLGRHHLMLSAFTLAFLFTPYFEQDSMFALVVLGGVAIGSLIIDIDGSDSAVMHSHIKGIRGNVGALINGLIAPILPIFGYITKYTIYKPSLWILSKTILIKYNKEEIEHHRGFSHSIIGVLSFAFVTGAYLLIICLLLDILNWLYFMSFILAYIFGAFMHMLEDSCTKSGIQWNSPFSKKLSDKMVNLTPKEIHIANLIKSGKSNKEISELLNSSIHTIASHRENIRKKTGLKNRKVNLRSFLSTLE